VITTVIAQLFSSMASRKKSTKILVEREIIMDIYTDSLSDIFDDESEDCFQSDSALIDQEEPSKSSSRCHGNGISGSDPQKYDSVDYFPDSAE
jgi:hypothetical protein